MIVHWLEVGLVCNLIYSERLEWDELGALFQRVCHVGVFDSSLEIGRDVKGVQTTV